MVLHALMLHVGCESVYHSLLMLPLAFERAALLCRNGCHYSRYRPGGSSLLKCTLICCDLTWPSIGEATPLTVVLGRGGLNNIIYVPVRFDTNVRHGTGGLTAAMRGGTKG